MSKRTERNAKVTANSSAVSREEARQQIMDVYSLSTFSGNVQRIIWQTASHLIGEDLKNAEWASCEQDTLDSVINGVLADALMGGANEDLVMGLDPKSYVNLVRYFEEVAVPKFYKQFPKEVFEVAEYRKVNAYEIDVVMEAGESATYKFRVSTLVPNMNMPIEDTKFIVKAPYNKYEAGKISHELVRDNWSVFRTFLKDEMEACVN